MSAKRKEVLKTHPLQDVTGTCIGTLLSLNLLVSEMFPVSAVCLNGCEHDNKPVIPTFGNLVLTENTEEIFRTRCLTPIRQQNVDSFGLFF